jgi:hypothetical protein
MKNLFTLALLFSLTTLFVNAQNKTTITATTSEISDNLDLRAIATIFGEASDLEDFERRINDPESQISNLDLNDDNYVDYLRVIESIEGNDHIIIIQSVIDKDLYQDVASIEVQKDRANNRVQVQIVGDVFMYGQNYIYEPVFVHTPMIYNTFWVNNYNPYFSNWHWGYYPTHFNYWSPFPIFRYRNHINLYVGGFGHGFNYVNFRRCNVGYNTYYGRRANAFETRFPNRSFASRNVNVSNRYELDRTRDTRTVNTRERGNSSTRSEGTTRESTSTRNENSTRNDNSRSETSTSGNSSTRSKTPRTTNSTRGNSSTRDNNVTVETPRSTTSTRGNSSSVETPRSTTSTRNETTRGNSASGSTTTTRNDSSKNNSSSTRATTSTRTQTPKVSSPSRSSSSNGNTRNSSSNGSSSRTGGRG